jgi:hypothetical protein
MVKEIRIWEFLALWRSIKIRMFITVVWNNPLCNLVVRQQRLFGNWLPATSNIRNRKFLKKSSKYFWKHIYIYIYTHPHMCVCVCVCLGLWNAIAYIDRCVLCSQHICLWSHFTKKSTETDNRISSPLNFLEVNIFLLQKWSSSCSLV